ncbi:hypothetical protein DFS34DRAFT_614295 [Phlyctochytrium arcticum]|nr:hypothetical protein DFS34DRAFT_614295 [Phlyctochytrium arcticum]
MVSTTSSNATSRSRKASPPKVSDHPPLNDLPEEEQWRIINETGILHKLGSSNQPLASKSKGKSIGRPAEAQEPPVLVALLLGIPLTLLHGTLDYIVHLQYDYAERFTMQHILRRQLPMLPLLCFFIYVTSRVKDWRAVQAAFMVGSVGAGCRLIWVSQVDETFGAMLQTPGLAVMWIYFVIQMKLSYAVASLVGCFLYYNRAFFEINKKIAHLG